MAQNAGKDPTENVSCGSCGAVNQVPFGLDTFKCYSCGTMVSISRETSAACPAAATTALYYDGIRTSAGGAGPARTSPGAGGGGGGSLAQPAAGKKGDAPGGFFGKLQKTVNRTVARVENQIEALTSSGKPQAQSQPLLDAPKRPPELSAEEEELQWALQASIAQAAIENPAAAPEAVPARAGPISPKGAEACDALQQAAAQASHRLQSAEDRARRAEQELASARSREATAEAERRALHRTLAEHESFIRGLMDQLDTVNAQLEEKSRQCEALEAAVAIAQEAARAADANAELRQTSGGEEMDDLEREGTISQLLVRIAELESTLLRATHFAPEVPHEPLVGDAVGPSAASPVAAQGGDEAGSGAVATPAAEAAAELAAEAAPPEAGAEAAADEVTEELAATAEEVAAKDAKAEFSPPPRGGAGAEAADDDATSAGVDTAGAGEATAMVGTTPGAANAATGVEALGSGGEPDQRPPDS